MCESVESLKVFPHSWHDDLDTSHLVWAVGDVVMGADSVRVVRTSR